MPFHFTRRLTRGGPLFSFRRYLARTFNAPKSIGWILLLGLSACRSVPLTVDADPNLPRLAAGGSLFHAEQFGPENCPVIVVLHGGPGADYRYLRGLAALATPYRVVFYDQRGSGLSPRLPASEISLNTFIDDLDAIIDQTSKGRPVHLIGHSWGAMLATAYTGRHPEKVDRLVLAEPGFLNPETLSGLPQGGWPGWRVIRGFTQAWLAKWFVDSGGDIYARDDWFLLQVLPFMQPEDALCQGKMPPLEAWRFGSPAFEATLGRMIKDPEWARTLDFTVGLEHYPRPVLFLRGACNVAQGEAHQRKMMAAFRSVNQPRLATIQGAGHFMFNDQPEVSMEVIRAFLQEK